MPDNDPILPEGDIVRLVTTWENARADLAVAAAAGRFAQKTWDKAISHELETHRLMTLALNARRDAMLPKC